MWRFGLSRVSLSLLKCEEIATLKCCSVKMQRRIPPQSPLYGNQGQEEKIRRELLGEKM